MTKNISLQSNVLHFPSDEPKTRDLWWTEIRTEMRSHMRALDCNCVVGYSERTTIKDELIVLSAIGTAAILNPSEATPGLTPFDELATSRKMGSGQMFRTRGRNSSLGTSRHGDGKGGSKHGGERTRLLSDASSSLTEDAEDRNPDAETRDVPGNDNCEDEMEDAFSISSRWLLMPILSLAFGKYALLCFENLFLVSMDFPSVPSATYPTRKGNCPSLSIFASVACASEFCISFCLASWHVSINVNFSTFSRKDDMQWKCQNYCFFISKLTTVTQTIQGPRHHFLHHRTTAGTPRGRKGVPGAGAHLPPQEGGQGRIKCQGSQRREWHLDSF